MKLFIYLIYILLKIISFIIPLILMICVLTLLERNLIGSIQRRRGPNVVGFFGILQPIADGIKLVLKETIIPSSATKFNFIIAPINTFLLSILAWAVIPIGKNIFIVTNTDLSLLYILAILSLNIYSLIMAGWASNSKYAFLGCLRSAAQMISYELTLGMVVLLIALSSQSLNLHDIVEKQTAIWYCFLYHWHFLIFLIVMLAESNRHPFDLPEAESELVSGYNIDYSAMLFALFFLGEYSYMLLMSAFGTTLFLGGWLPVFSIFNNSIDHFLWFGLKMCFFLFIYIISRAAYPRYRYDQLMFLGWKVLLPISFFLFIFYTAILILFNII